MEMNLNQYRVLKAMREHNIAGRSISFGILGKLHEYYIKAVSEELKMETFRVDTCFKSLCEYGYLTDDYYLTELGKTAFADFPKDFAGIVFQKWIPLAFSTIATGLSIFATIVALSK